ncbi:MAG: ATP-binding protein [Candidatus Hydrogenedentes bacterium]|nr:ATP-binding protein [Candidatus Hydrogenedentota bacterium]
MKPHGEAHDRDKKGYRWSIPSSLTRIEPLCQDTRAILTRHSLSRYSYRTEVLLREFMNNAIVHGNQSDVNKAVTVSMRINQESVELEITDEGPGFDWKAVPLEPPDESATSGRGLAIGAIYADGMFFNERGNQVTLRLNTGETKENSR